MCNPTVIFGHYLVQDRDIQRDSMELYISACALDGYHVITVRLQLRHPPSYQLVLNIRTSRKGMPRPTTIGTKAKIAATHSSQVGERIKLAINPKNANIGMRSMRNIPVDPILSNTKISSRQAILKIQRNNGLDGLELTVLLFTPSIMTKRS